jgi:membrane protein YdbS with pleckstrin-like domain
MCLIIAVFSLIYAFVAFNAGNIASGSVAIVIALFFVGLLIKNVTDVKKMREERKEELEKEEN